MIIVAVHPTVEQTKAIVAILGDAAEAGQFLCSLGLTYYQACRALDAADVDFVPPLPPITPGFYPTRQGSTQAGTAKG